MDDSPDRDFISSITTDVMGCLGRSQFFAKLDDLLCPTGGTGPQAKECCGDYKLSEAILREAGYDSLDLQDIFDVLRAQGGCCDCEILYNFAGASRLKANYWRRRAHELDSQSRQ